MKPNIITTFTITGASTLSFMLIGLETKELIIAVGIVLAGNVAGYIEGRLN